MFKIIDGKIVLQNVVLENPDIDADGIAFTPAQGITATEVQTAIEEAVKKITIPIKEENTSALIKGQVVCATGASGEKVKIGLCDCTNPAKIRIMGLVSTDLAQNASGHSIFRGELPGIDSRATNLDINPNAETWAEGAMLWQATTAGGMTHTRPTHGRSIKAAISRKGSCADDILQAISHENPVNVMAAAGEDIVFGMGDSAGVNKVLYKNHAGSLVAAIDSYGLRNYADYKTIYIDAAEFIPATTNGALQGTYEEPNNDIDLDIFLFEGGATPQRIICKKKLPENWNRGVIIGAKFDWNSESGSTAGDTVEWRIKMGAIGDSDAIDTALGTRQVISDTLLADSGADWQTSPKTPNITVAGSPAVGDAIIIEIDRNGPGADTMAEKARFHGVTLQIKLAGAVALWA